MSNKLLVPPLLLLKMLVTVKFGGSGEVALPVQLGLNRKRGNCQCWMLRVLLAVMRENNAAAKL
jgi:hypothetical protein